MNNFLKMFKINCMTPEIKEQLFESVSILITHSSCGEQYERLQKVLERLKYYRMVF